MPKLTGQGSARTQLELLIWRRRQTFEDFVEFANSFARDHDESGRLSYRNVVRLAAGRGDGNRPLGRPLPSTARLLERIFGAPIEQLLAPPLGQESPALDTDSEIRRSLRASAHVDRSVLALLQNQLTATRRLDRQLGAAATSDEVLTKVTQVERLLEFSITPVIREQLAVLLSELYTLAGWQALDSGKTSDAWHRYTRARTAASECRDPAHAAHAAAGQAFVLIDIGHAAEAIELLDETSGRASAGTGRHFRSWLSAAHGEALAADGRRDDSLRAFDRAQELLGDGPDESGPYVVLDAVHLARWRGHALARIGEPEAIDVLSSALDRLDPSFARAETALRVDLATAFASKGERDTAHEHATRADVLAAEIGSARQRRRIRALINPVS